MNERIVMGYWDCSHCGNKKVKGTERSCPNCGFIRNEHTEFYMSGEIEYLSEKDAETKGKGADWVCPYCGKLNSVTVASCVGCGALKNESEQDYFSVIKGKAEKHEESQNIQKPEFVAGHPFKIWIKANVSLLFSVVFAFLILVGIMWMIRPTNIKFTISGVRWERTIDIEEYKTVEESGWSIPFGGKEKYTKSEIHHYNRVIDHYETKTETYTEQVYDGEETYYTYLNNGDGTFTQKLQTRPKYRTEVKTKNYQEPVYRSDPIYQTKYYYDIKRWVYKDSVKTAGSDKKPYWKELNLTENEREGARHEQYFVSGTDENGKKSEYEAKYDIWLQLKQSKIYYLKVKNSFILEILE